MTKSVVILEALGQFVDRDVDAKGKEDRARHAAEVASRP